MRLLALLALSACANGNSNDCNGPCAADLAVPVSDLAVAADMATVDLASSSGKPDLARVYVPATLHDIDTGAVAAATYVLVSGAVITTPAHPRSTSGGMCTYQAWAQDPAGAAPCGIQLFTVQPAVAGSCPLPPSSGGVFDGRAVGDNVDIRGKVYVDSFAGDGGTLTQHSVYVDSFTATTGTATITAVDLDDPSQFGGYGAGFDANEGMLVTLSCSPSCKVTFVPNPYLWGVTGGALFGSEFSSLWGGGKPGAVNTAYTSITGVVSTFLTGSIEPRSASDFTP